MNITLLLMPGYCVCSISQWSNKNRSNNQSKTFQQPIECSDNQSKAFQQPIKNVPKTNTLRTKFPNVTCLRLKRKWLTRGLSSHKTEEKLHLTVMRWCLCDFKINVFATGLIIYSIVVRCRNLKFPNNSMEHHERFLKC